jgi:hypothetical protein
MRVIEVGQITFWVYMELNVYVRGLDNVCNRGRSNSVLTCSKTNNMYI